MRPTSSPERFRLVLALAALGVSACGSPVQPQVRVPNDSITVQTGVPSQGTDSTLDIGNWNVLWFGSADHGPTDEALQLQNVADVMSGADLDIWGLEEVVDAGQFARLLADLPGYAGILANDPSVVDGAAYYSDFGNTEQKVALVYRTSQVTVRSARVILADHNYQFAGRPPVEFRLTVGLEGSSEDLVVIVMHAKSGSDAASYSRRDAAAQALKSYLDTTLPTQKVMVIGDFNDDVDISITPGEPSPYRYFVDDPADYAFPSKELSDAHLPTETSYPDAIDHQLNSNEVYATYVPGTVKAFRADQYISNYGSTTSDHYPVIAHYTMAGSGSAGRVFINEIEANPAGSDTGNEWVELFNRGTADVDLTGWVLTAHGGSPATRTLSGTLPAGGFLVVTDPSQWLDNSGEWLTLTDAQGLQVDSTPTFDDGANDDRTRQRTPDGGSTWEFRTATKGVGNGPSGAEVNLTATGSSLHGENRVELAWSNATGALVDVYRNGVLFATAGNDRADADDTSGRRSATYVHKVCEAGTTICSKETTTVF